jgi:hypothetical protein
MDVLAKYFDHYVINARLKPAFFALMPIAITTLVVHQFCFDGYLM